MNRAIRVGAAILVLAGIPTASFAEQRVRTAEGREVILRDDGTWIYADELKKAPKAVLQFQDKRGNYALYLPPNKWKKTEGLNESADVQFRHVDGDAFAMVIAERFMLPLDTLKEAAISNIQDIDPAATVVKEERRKVNGREVLCMTINAKPKGIPATYYGYYYTGEEGSIQVITFTAQNLFKEIKPELDAFLNGFTLLKKP